MGREKGLKGSSWKEREMTEEMNGEEREMVGSDGKEGRTKRRCVER